VKQKLLNLKRFEKLLSQWMASYSIVITRTALGIIFIWFGILKFFPELSPAEDLASRTVEKLTFGFISDQTALLILATWECLIGIGCITGKFMRTTLILLFLQMFGTIMPLFIFPDITFISAPFIPTLEGQYIIKNVLILSSAIVLMATVRGGAIVSDPRIAEQAKKQEEEKMERLKK
jgi:uncharacterized membrane protein YphA (DoxX/SURF4 family)